MDMMMMNFFILLLSLIVGLLIVSCFVEGD